MYVCMYVCLSVCRVHRSDGKSTSGNSPKKNQNFNKLALWESADWECALMQKNVPEKIKNVKKR